MQQAKPIIYVKHVTYGVNMANDVRVIIVDSCLNCVNLAGTGTIWWCLESVGELEFIDEDAQIPSHIIDNGGIWETCPLDKLSIHTEAKP